MIKVVIFDLDGTLVQTEVLKARSYALAIYELTNGEVAEDRTLDFFSQVVGLSRQEVVERLSQKFYRELGQHLGLEDMESIGGKLIEKRLKIYRKILDDENLLSENFCAFTLGLFHKLYENDTTLVLATMSHLPEAKKVTETMGIFDKFDLIFTRDDVENGKPEPDIYLKARDVLGLSSEQCLVIEDSVNGIKAAQNAGMPVFAVTNNITRDAVHNCKLLDADFIVDDLNLLERRIFDFISSKEE